jgi:transcriptional regulator with XRE-family HTH domain
MGHSREKALNLPQKLLLIREYLGLSQNELVRQLGLENKVSREDISKFERGIREPSLPTLLKYARSVGISTDILIDDEVELPFLKT